MNQSDRDVATYVNLRRSGLQICGKYYQDKRPNSIREDNKFSINSVFKSSVRTSWRALNKLEVRD